MHAYALETNVTYLSLAETTPHDWQPIHSRLMTLARERGATDAEEARLLREAERIGIWRKVGEPTMAAYVEHRLGYGPRCAYDRLRVARALGELPLMEQMLVAGDLFYSVVRELTRVATSETEARWLDAAIGKRLREVERMVSGRAHGDHPEAPSRPENIRHVLTHEVSAEAYALVRQARRVLQDELGERLDDSAFLAMLAMRALQLSEQKGTRNVAAMVKCEDCKRAWRDDVELPARTIERIECDADTMDETGTISRTIPAATRRVVLLRDRNQCRVPWCRSTRHLQPHHIQHFAHGGNHDADNLLTLCWAHHKALHDGVLTLTMENGTPKFEHTEKNVPANETQPPSMTETAIRALVGMGFKKSEAQSFVETAIAHGGKSMTLSDLMREALRRSPTPGG